MKTNKPAKAISTLQQATKIEPTLTEGWYELGRAHMLAREWNMARGALENARQLNPLAPEITNAIATCLLRMNKRAEARRMIDASLQHDPNNAEARRIQKQL
jgi:cytochrome c-type biogenesis protein CcmH/NrfG